MEIQSVHQFISYYERTREATERIIQAIPKDKLDWTYAPGKFTFGDMIRHIAAIERHVFMEVIQGNKPTYAGCGKELADGYEEVMAYVHVMHRQFLDTLNRMSDSDLQQPVTTLNGQTTTVANFLRALIVHEVHHRGALCIYLNLINVESPPVIGLTEKQVIELSKNNL